MFVACRNYYKVVGGNVMLRRKKGDQRPENRQDAPYLRPKHTVPLLVHPTGHQPHSSAPPIVLGPHASLPCQRQTTFIRFNAEPVWPSGALDDPPEAHHRGGHSQIATGVLVVEGSVGRRGVDVGAGE